MWGAGRIKVGLVPENQAALNSNITAGLLLVGDPMAHTQCKSNICVIALISDTLNGGF